MHTLLIFAPCFIEIYGSWNPFQICNSKICEKSFIGKIFYFVRIQDMQTFTFSDKWFWCANSIEFRRPSIILKEYYTFPYCLKISEKELAEWHYSICSIQGICNWEENIHETFTRIIDKKTIICFFLHFLENNHYFWLRHFVGNQ